MGLSRRGRLDGHSCLQRLALDVCLSLWRLSGQVLHQCISSYDLYELRAGVIALPSRLAGRRPRSGRTHDGRVDGRQDRVMAPVERADDVAVIYLSRFVDRQTEHEYTTIIRLQCFVWAAARFVPEAVVTSTTRPRYEFAATRYKTVRGIKKIACHFFSRSLHESS